MSVPVIRTCGSQTNLMVQRMVLSHTQFSDLLAGKYAHSMRNYWPPKGKNAAKKGEIPEDKGTELFDCEGDELLPDDIADPETDKDEVMDIDTAVETQMGDTSETIEMSLVENTDPDQRDTPSLFILSQLTADAEFLNDA